MKTIGIDIGGTQLRAAIFDEEKHLLDKYVVPNNQSKDAKENTDKLISYILKQEGPFEGIGIGCPGPISIRTGKILNPPNLPAWWDFDIAKYIEEKTKIKTLLNNDANVAGLSEALLGAGKGYESVFYITISTGVGGAYVYQGKLVNGANSTAAEIYNLIINEDTFCHNGVNPGAVNEQCSGSALARIASETYGEEMDAKELFERYYQKDVKAKEIVERCAENMGKCIANISCIVDPDIFIIGGSVAIFNPEFVDLMREKAKKYVINPEFLHIEHAKFGDDAGLIGAAFLV